MRDELLNLPGVRVYTPQGASLVTFTVRGIGSQEVAARLDEADIAVRGGLHCAPGAHRFMGTLQSGAVRVSPGEGNTREHVLALADVVQKY